MTKTRLPAFGPSTSLGSGGTRYATFDSFPTSVLDRVEASQGNSMENYQSILQPTYPLHGDLNQAISESTIRQIQQDLWQIYRQESNSSGEESRSVSVAPSLLQSDSCTSNGGHTSSSTSKYALDSRLAQEQFLYPDFSAGDRSHQQFISSVFNQFFTPFDPNSAQRSRQGSQNLVADPLPRSPSSDRHPPPEIASSSSSSSSNKYHRDILPVTASPSLSQKGKSRARRRSGGDPERDRMMAKVIKIESETLPSNQDIAHHIEADRRFGPSEDDILESKDVEALSKKIRKVLLPTRSASLSDDIRMTIRHICPHKNCSKDFSTSGHARRHYRIHDTFRQFGCPHEDCIALFTRRDNCKQHQKNSHDHILNAVTFDHKESKRRD